MQRLRMNSYSVLLARRGRAHWGGVLYRRRVFLPEPDGIPPRDLARVRTRSDVLHVCGELELRHVDLPCPPSSHMI